MSVAASLLAFGVSIHNPETEGRREWFNPGLGLVIQNDRVRGLAGYYRNSEDEDSFFVGAGGEFPLTRSTGATLSAIVVTGYESIPMLAPVATYYYEHNDIRIHAALVPEAAALFFEYRL